MLRMSSNPENYSYENETQEIFLIYGIGHSCPPTLENSTL